MILQQETYETFGYYPKNISHGSEKTVFFKCKKCSTIFKTKMSNAVRNKSGCCKICSLIGPREYRRAKSDRYEPLSNYQLCDVLYGVRMSVSKGVICQSKGKNIKSFNGCHLTPTLEKQLGLNRDNWNVKIIRSTIVKQILTKSFQEITNAMFYILSNHRSLAVSEGHGLYYTVSDSKKIVRCFFDKLNIEYSVKSKKSYSKKAFCENIETLVVKKGSFYVDGRWIHVG